MSIVWIFRIIKVRGVGAEVCRTDIFREQGGRSGNAKPSSETEKSDSRRESHRPERGKKLKKTLIGFLILFSTVLAGADIFDEIKKARRFELAEAYYQTGIRFEELGQKDRGESFKEAAARIFPGYTPGMTAPSAAPSSELVPPALEVPDAVSQAPELPVNELTGLPIRPQVKENNIDGAKIVRLQFSKLIRSALTQNIETLLSVLAPGVKGPGFENGIEEREAAALLRGFFAANDTKKLSPSLLYDMTSLTVEKVSGMPEDMILTVHAASGSPGGLALSELVPFWKETQRFYFIRQGDSWKLQGISN